MGFLDGEDEGDGGDGGDGGGFEELICSEEPREMGKGVIALSREFQAALPRANEADCDRTTTVHP